jgi:hypothetical protein
MEGETSLLLKLCQHHNHDIMLLVDFNKSEVTSLTLNLEL